MITTDSRPMSAAPLDGTPVRLFFSVGSAIASFWSEERCQRTFGAGDYRAGWYLLDDDAIELDKPMGWEPLIQDYKRVLTDKVLATTRRILAAAIRTQ